MPSCFGYSLRGARFTRLCDVIDYVTNRFAIGQFLLVVHWNWSSISCRFNIFTSKYIWLTILTFWDHLMLSVTWDNGSKHFGVVDLSGSRDVIGHVTIGLSIPHFLFMLHCDQAPISSLFEILDPKDNWVTTLTFLGHVTSSVTWPLGSPYPISYSCSIVTKPLSPTLFEILDPKDNWVTTLTFLGHLTSSVTWPLDSTYPISYSCSIVTKPLSPALFEILGPKNNWATTLTFLGHVTSSVTWPLDSHIPFPIRAPLWPSPYLQPFSRYWAPKSRAHTHTHTHTPTHAE